MIERCYADCHIYNGFENAAPDYPKRTAGFIGVKNNKATVTLKDVYATGIIANSYYAGMCAGLIGGTDYPAEDVTAENVYAAVENADWALSWTGTYTNAHVLKGTWIVEIEGVSVHDAAGLAACDMGASFTFPSDTPHPYPVLIGLPVYCVNDGTTHAVLNEITEEDDVIFKNEMTAEDNMTVKDKSMTSDEMLIEDEVPVEDEVLVEDDMATEDETTVKDETMAEDEMTADDEVISENEVTAKDETAAEDETVAEDEVTAEG